MHHVCTDRTGGSSSSLGCKDSSFATGSHSDTVQEPRNVWFKVTKLSSDMKSSSDPFYRITYVISIGETLGIPTYARHDVRAVSKVEQHKII